MAEYIKRQQDEKIGNMRWGRFSTIGKNGCGAVAAYNTAVALGKDPDFLQLIREMEKKHMPFLGGIWGTCIFDLKFYLAKKFGRADLYFFGTEDWDEKTRFCRAVVIFYKNKGWFKGNHFITGVRVGEDFVFYNAPVLPSTKALPMHEAMQKLKKAGHLPVFLMVI